MATSTSAALIYPRFRAFTAAGAPLSGGKLESFAAGTATPLALFPTAVDAKANTNPLSNPVILDANGEATCFGQNLPYKLILKDSGGATQWTVDDVFVGMAPPLSSTTVVKNGNQAEAVAATKISTWTVEVDSQAEWSAANNRFVATAAGKYQVLLSVDFADTNANIAHVYSIFKNGAQVSKSTVRSWPTATNITNAQVQWMGTLAANDFIEAFFASAVTGTTQGGVGTRLTVIGLGPT